MHKTWGVNVTTKIKYRTGKTAKWKEMSLVQLADFCVMRTGGGYNESQVMKAMMMQDSIMRGNVYKAPSGFEIKVEEIE